MSDRPGSDTLVNAQSPLRPQPDPRGQHLHIDCASGAAGDMLLAALIDLGAPLDDIGQALDAIGVGRQRLSVNRIVKGGIAAVDVKVDVSPPAPAPAPAPERRVPQAAEPSPLLHAQPVATPPRAHPHPSSSPPPPAHAGHGHDHPHAPAAISHPHPQAAHAYPRAPSQPGVVPAPGAPPKKRAGTQAEGPFVAITFRAETHDHRVEVDELGDKVEHVHEHSAHGESHAHHAYADIRWRISSAPLTEGTRARALDIFDRLARAEAKLHGTTIENVTFHEVGAIDSIVDVVGTAAALDWLAPVAVSCVSIAMGHGTVRSAHGTLPVPAPAALEIMREAGGIMVDGGVPRELCTPTGAAILAHAVSSWQPSPPGRVVAVGWGAGDMELPDRPNVVRVVALAPARMPAREGVPGLAMTSPSGAVISRGDTVIQIEANLDDMSPELCGPALDAVFAAGAVDAWWTAITMKKGRPALMLSALVEESRRDDVIATILRETTTIGVRFTEMQRTVLTRKVIEVETRYGIIPVKVALDGDVVRNAAPEYEACAAAARVHGVPVKLVFAAALSAYSDG